MLFVLIRCLRACRMAAFGSFTEPTWWPSPLFPPPCRQAFQALDGCGKSVPLGFQVNNDPVEVHLMPPSEAGQHIRVATESLGGSGCPGGSTDRRSPEIGRAHVCT